MRTVKLSLLIVFLALFSVRCSDTKKVPGAEAAMIKNKMVRIATNPFTAPFETSSGTGVEGFDVNLGEAIAKDLNFPTKWIQWNSFEKLFELLKNGEVEMVISSVAISDDLKKDFAFSEPYYDTSNTIARRKENPEIKDLASLAGKKVGVQTARTADTFMAKQTTAANVTVLKFPSTDEALGALNRREIDAVVGDKVIVSYSIAKGYSANLMSTDVDLGRYQYAVLVRPTEKKLLATINATIQKLKSSGELQAWDKTLIRDIMDKITAIAGEFNKNEELKIAPKTLSVNLIKEAGSTIRLDRLEGFNAVISGAGGNFTSSPITADEAGMRGSCRFSTPIPPGEYNFVLSRLKVSQPITIEKKAVTAMTMTLTFTRSGGLVLDWK